MHHRDRRPVEPAMTVTNQGCQDPSLHRVCVQVCIIYIRSHTQAVGSSFGRGCLLRSRVNYVLYVSRRNTATHNYTYWGSALRTCIVRVGSHSSPRTVCILYAPTNNFCYSVVCASQKVSHLVSHIYIIISVQTLTIVCRVVSSTYYMPR